MKKLYGSIFAIFMLISGFIFSSDLAAQVVKQPKSAVSQTYKRFYYTYNLSSTQYKVIEYILVQASNGDIKSVFNACDVCYNYHKGYSQNGTKLVCNNCANTFQIDGLGGSGTGGTCNPGYLPHSLDGDSVVINVADLVKGAYFFLTQTISDVAENTEPRFSIENYYNTELNVKFMDSYPNNIKIYSIDGKLLKQFIPESKEFHINISDLYSGSYFISIKFDDSVLTKKFFILK